MKKGAETASKGRYRLLATSCTSTMQKELKEAGAAGYEFMGVVVGKTSLRGRQVVGVLQKVSK